MRSLDFFAVPVSLTYKGQKSFKTFVGGCISLLLLIVCVTHATISLYVYITDPKLSNSSETIYFSQAENNETYNIATVNSTTAVRV